MSLKWTAKTTFTGCETHTTRMGSLILVVEDTDGESQTYGIFTETKAIPGIKSKERLPVFLCDPYLGGVNHAKRRVEELAKTIYYQLPLEFNQWEKQHGRYVPRRNMTQQDPTTKINDLWIKGIYYLPKHNLYFRLEYVSNIGEIQSRTDPRAKFTLGTPSVVIKEIYSDQIYTLSLDDFKARGFTHFLLEPDSCFI